MLLGVIRCLLFKTMALINITRLSPLAPFIELYVKILTLHVKIWDFSGNRLRLTKAIMNRGAYLSTMYSFQVEASTILNTHQIPNALPHHPVPSGMTGLSKPNRL